MDELQHVVAGYHQRRAVVVGVEADLLGVEEVPVHEEGHLVVRVVYKCKQRHAARPHTEVAHHALRAGEAEFPLVQAVLHVVDVHREAAVHDDEVVAVALVVAEEEVLAERGALATVELRGPAHPA